MKNRKIFFVLILCGFTTKTFSQNWDSASQLDTSYNSNGTITRIYNFENFEGIRFEYDRMGNLTSKTFTSTKNKTQYDMITEYYSNGKMHRQYFCYVKDKVFFGMPLKDSTLTEYCDNGTLSAIYFYRGDKLDGKSIYYYPNGLVMTELEYSQDKLLNVKYYDTTGKCIDSGNFKNGNGELIIYIDGKQKEICHYKNGRQVKCRQLQR